LIVDDNVDAARSLALLLGPIGYEVLLAHDGPAGLEMVHRHHSDVIILDIGLPRLDGYEVARAVREDEAIPIIALSGYAPEDSSAAAPRPAVMRGVGQERFDLLPKQGMEFIAASHGGPPFGIPPPPSYPKNQFSDVA
jgi:CheY-like chemotaxis protein